jgi:hypothetical protein
MNQEKKTLLERKIRMATWVTIIGLVINGLTALSLSRDLSVALSFKSLLPDSFYNWFVTVQAAVTDTKAHYAFMLYGYDWLGFAHLFIAIAFIGVLKDPIKNEWVVQFGMIVSALTVVIALLFERLRDIPFTWSMVDVVIGIGAFIILYLCSRWINEWKKLSVS